MAHFSVVIPVHNRPQYVRACLQSVFDQRFTDYEIVVVDDGSDDETAALLATFRDRIRLIRQRQSGVSAARNRGIREARGDYIAFLDSDDLWYPWTLKVHAQAIEAYDRPAFLAGTFTMMTGDDLPPVTAESTEAERFDDYLQASSSGRCWYGGTCGVAIRREMLTSVDGFDETLTHAEDLDLWLRLGTAPGFIQIHTPALFAYRQHSGNAAQQSDRSYEGVQRMIRRELAAAYPGGAERAPQRQRLITMASRQTSLTCVRTGLKAKAWHLYRQTLPWHLRQGRLKYLLAFPWLGLIGRALPRTGD